MSRCDSLVVKLKEQLQLQGELKMFDVEMDVYFEELGYGA